MSLLNKQVLLVVCCLITCSCKFNLEYLSKPTKSISHPDSDLLEVNVVAFHNTDSTSEIYFQINNQNLLYKRPDTSQSFYAELKLSHKLINEQHPKQISDSSFFYLEDHTLSERVDSKYLYQTITIPTQWGANYFLDYDILDINKKTSYNSRLLINKQNKLSPQNFLIKTKNSVAFKNTFLKSQQVQITMANTTVKQLSVSCFTNEIGPALPPFSTKVNEEKNRQADSSYILHNSQQGFEFMMPQQGFYFIQSDTKSEEGLALFTVDESFPGVSTSREMVLCTRYIMNHEEFEACTEASDKKAAIDKFWLGIGGSNERARELLKRYYGRVKEANLYFTSFAQGWKSDRGMIFIVFGAPNTTYKNKNSEVWVYGNEANPSTLRFEFKKVQSPFTDNEYVLERSTFYKEAYYQAVDYWRQGNIYIDGRK